MEEDELLDLVSEQDEPIGTIWRSKYDKLVSEKLGYIRAVELFIQNDKGELWIPTRTMHKRIAPGGLDYSMGGHVSVGESYIESALREIKEELNLDLNEDDLTFVQKFKPTDVPYFRILYLYHSNQVPEYNPEDFTSAEWMTPADLIKKLDAGTPAKGSLRETVQVLL